MTSDILRLASILAVFLGVVLLLAWWSGTPAIPEPTNPGVVVVDRTETPEVTTPSPAATRPTSIATHAPAAAPPFGQDRGSTATAAAADRPIPADQTPLSGTPLPTLPVAPRTPQASPTMPPGRQPCPDPAPVKPAYDRYFLDSSPWPTPDPLGDPAHFWLAKPLPGGGRMITTQWLPYGYDAGRYLLHNGVDIAEAMGTPILAAAAGTVVVAGTDLHDLYGWRCDWYGQLVVIEMDTRWRGQPIYVLYGHVLNISVVPGQRVRQGDRVAEVGIGGAATLPHVHLEIRVGGNTFADTRNPLLWYWPGATRGVIAGRLIDPEGRPWQGVGITAVRKGEADPDLINTWSYLGDPDNLINPDEGYAENFLFSDMLPGEYNLYVSLQGVEYRVSVTVNPGTISPVTIVTEPYRAPSPAPPP